MLSTNFKTNGLSFLTVLCAAVILLWFINLAWTKSKADSQSKVILNNAQALTQALSYFYNDQDRYPTALEFLNLNSFGAYLTPFPVEEFFSKKCQQNFSYKRLDSGSYILSFCIPAKTGFYEPGWNDLKP